VSSLSRKRKQSSEQARSTGSIWKNIDPERYQHQKSAKTLATATCSNRHIRQLSFTAPLNSYKTTPNDINYHLAAAMFVTFPTKHN
jgi:hypothetical protein